MLQHRKAGFFWKGSSLLSRSACALQKGNTGCAPKGGLAIYRFLLRPPGWSWEGQAACGPWPLFSFGAVAARGGAGLLAALALPSAFACCSGGPRGPRRLYQSRGSYRLRHGGAGGRPPARSPGPPHGTRPGEQSESSETHTARRHTNARV
jgi:hypothetical protein